jgi:hypothetical protein
LRENPLVKRESDGEKRQIQYTRSGFARTRLRMAALGRTTGPISAYAEHKARTSLRYRATRLKRIRSSARASSVHQAGKAKLATADTVTVTHTRRLAQLPTSQISCVAPLRLTSPPPTRRLRSGLATDSSCDRWPRCEPSISCGLGHLLERLRYSSSSASSSSFVAVWSFSKNAATSGSGAGRGGGCLSRPRSLMR